ncbi:MAG: short-chain dehydrogenase [Methylocystaceae bacterium]|nr:MAG: short-chain dehydrogenase [Methylocystaceae bacterium]
MGSIPRYRQQTGPAVLSAGFRPFFLFAAIWAFFVVPASIASLAGVAQLPSAFVPNVWHAHEMAFGYGGAVVAGFLLTAIPNWTGQLPLQGGPLAALVIFWLCGRLAVLFSSAIGVVPAAILDLAFPAVFLAVVAREIAVGRNWRNLPMVGALALLFIGNALTHADVLGLVSTVDIGNRLGVATLLMLVSLIGGRIVPSFTRNWLVKLDPNVATPAPFDLVDRTALAAAVVALLAWAVGPETPPTAWLALFAGGALAARLARWRGEKTVAEPLLWVLHLGYGWLSFGLLLLGLNGLAPLLPPTSALHALTVGALGTMTLGVMTRASLGHTGRTLTAGRRTTAIYLMVTLAVLLRLFAPLFGAHYVIGLSLAAVAWCGAFGSFALFYFRPLTQPRLGAEGAPPI